VAGDNPREHPSAPSDRLKRAGRIAEISHRITDAGNAITGVVRGIGDQLCTLHDQIQSNNKTTDTREQGYYDSSIYWLKRGTIFAIIFAVVGLITTTASLYILHNQLKSDRIERRAWVNVELKEIQFTENKPLMAQLSIKNTGKTPAKHMSSKFMVQNIKKDMSPRLEFEGTLFNLTAGILNPEVTVTSAVPMLRDNGTILKPPLLTKAEVAAIQTGETYVVVLGRIEYSDIYEIAHWHNVCFWYVSPGINRNYPTRKCVEHNDIDNN